MPNPQEFNSVLTANGASGLKKIGDPSAMVCNDLGMLTADSDYTFVYGKGSVWAELEGARTTHQGTPNRITDLHEKDVSHGTPPINPRASATLNVPSCPWSQAAAALETQLEEKYGGIAVTKLPNAELTAPARMPASGVQTNRKPQGSVPDGAFLVTLADAQMVYVLEAKFDGDVRSSALPPQTSICRTYPIPCFFTPPMHLAGRCHERKAAARWVCNGRNAEIPQRGNREGVQPPGHHARGQGGVEEVGHQELRSHRQHVLRPGVSGALGSVLMPDRSPAQSSGLSGVEQLGAWLESPCEARGLCADSLHVTIW